MSCSSGRTLFLSLRWMLLMTGVFAGSSGCGSEAGSPTSTPDEDWQLQLQLKLPAELREISGLAETASGTLLAVADEQALIFEIDLQAATAEVALAIGEPTLAGDFEGIEQVGQQVWLVDSDGNLLWSDGEHYDQAATGLGETCEIEGLAQDPQSEHLLLLCKQVRGKELAKDQLYLRAVSVESAQRVPDADLIFDLGEALSALQLKKLNPSGVSLDPAGDRIAIVAAKQKSLLVFARHGQLLQARRLPAVGKHRQAEGISILRDGRLAIADEGGKKSGRLSIYHRVP